MGKPQLFDIILADPPWTYNDKLTPHNRGSECNYNVMNEDQLSNLKINKIASDNCALFMWCTLPKLIEGSCTRVMKSWGFIPKTMAFVWIKTNNNGKPSMGLGHWTRGNAEGVMLGIKGKPKRVNAGVEQIILSKRTKHSIKPNEVHDRIDTLMGNKGNKLELFARRDYKDWFCIGDELNYKIEDWIEGLID